MNNFSLIPSPSMTPPVVLKWVGSKGPLAPHICSLLLPLLAHGGSYFEPFAGSLAVFFSLRSMGWKGPATLSDILEPVINFYCAIYIGEEFVYQRCRETEAAYQKAENKKEFYKRQRDLLNQKQGTQTERAGLFWWINHRAYNGLWRTNAKGEMTTDWGGERTYLPSFRKLQQAANLLYDNADFYARDFEDILLLSGRGDVIYADPPYAQGYRYYAGSFKKADQERLARCLQDAYQRGASVIASNADTPEVRALYSWADIKPISLNYSVGGAVHKEGKEVLISAVHP